MEDWIDTATRLLAINSVHRWHRTNYFPLQIYIPEYVSSCYSIMHHLIPENTFRLNTPNTYHLIPAHTYHLIPFQHTRIISFQHTRIISFHSSTHVIISFQQTHIISQFLSSRPICFELLCFRWQVKLCKAHQHTSLLLTRLVRDSGM
jgi:hypothetical protein